MLFLFDLGELVKSYARQMTRIVAVSANQKFKKKKYNTWL